ncbi:hypothetical protein [uncultured Shimia sp.]|uniref:hypothetical protein n=1 Tax=uncultured Shimia sp. TaxID=573152 RepID=UPI0025D85E93|nr:hypothetical protein [uncultured Shimia sp.]
MVKIFEDLLAIDGMARKAGCGLKPEVRAALEASLRFPAKAASPMPNPDDMTGPLPNNVLRLDVRSQASSRRKEA